MVADKTLGAQFLKNALSPRMKRVKNNFFKLFDEGYIDSIAVRPIHGPLKGQEISIHERDIYSVMAYKDNVAALRVSWQISDAHRGVKMPSRDGLIFVTADEDYMKFLFEGDFENNFWITPEQAEWCADFVDGVLYEKRYGKPHPCPLPAFPK